MNIVLILLCIYGTFFCFLVFKTKRITKNDSTEEGKEVDLSVLIPFRDEELQLTFLVDCIRNTNYTRGKVEFIFINDHSRDGGKELLEKRARELSPRDIKILDLKDTIGKKQAIRFGVSKAQYQNIVQIDADVHFGENYLESIAKLFKSGKADLILGVVKADRGSNVLGVLQHAELNAIMALTYYTTLQEIPILANGASMAYTKKLYTQVEVLREDYEISSGDDVFLLYEAKKIEGIQIVFNNDEEGHVSIKPKLNLKNFVDQRIRWAQKSKHFKDKNTRLIGVLIVLMNSTVLALMFGVILQWFDWVDFLMLFIIKWLMDILFVLSYNHRIKKLTLIADSLMLSVFYPFYTISIAFLSLLYRPTWKGRKIQ